MNIISPIIHANVPKTIFLRKLSAFSRSQCPGIVSRINLNFNIRKEFAMKWNCKRNQTEALKLIESESRRWKVLFVRHLARSSQIFISKVFHHLVVTKINLIFKLFSLIRVKTAFCSLSRHSYSWEIIRIIKCQWLIEAARSLFIQKSRWNWKSLMLFLVWEFENTENPIDFGTNVKWR